MIPPVFPAQDRRVDIRAPARQTASPYEESLLINVIYLNLLAGTFVVGVGFWIIWGTGSPAIAAGAAIVVGVFLWWRARMITEVWAWSTLFLGLESFAWPLTLMAQLKETAPSPSDDDMGTILSAVVLGLLSSVFWISFAYGLFRRAWNLAAGPPGSTAPTSTEVAAAQRSAGLTPSPRDPRRRRT